MFRPVPRPALALVAVTFLVAAPLSAGGADGADVAGAIAWTAPGPDAWRAAVRLGEPLALELPTGPVLLRLEPNTELFGPGFAVVDDKGHAVDLTDVLVLKGTVVG